VQVDPTVWTGPKPSDAVLELHMRAADAGLAPAIVESEGDPITMQRLERTLLDFWNDPNSDQEARTTTVFRLVERINALHQIGICHRDLHSENVMIDEGEVVFIDFVLAQDVNPVWQCYDLTGPNEHILVPHAHAIQPGHEGGVWWGPVITSRCLAAVIGPQPANLDD